MENATFHLKRDRMKKTAYDVVDISKEEEGIASLYGKRATPENIFLYRKKHDSTNLNHLFPFLRLLKTLDKY